MVRLLMRKSVLQFSSKMPTGIALRILTNFAARKSWTKSLIRKTSNDQVKCFGTAATVPASLDKNLFSRDKPHCNVGTIGNVGNGKTTLTSAITKVLAEQKLAVEKKCAEIDFDPEEQKRGMSMKNTQLEYFTDKRHYVHTDLPGHTEYAKNMLCGLSQLDGAILVVAAADGPTLQTREQLLWAKQCGIQHVVVFINKVDEVDNEMVSLVEMDIREILTKLGFDGVKVPVISGSALCTLQNKKSDIGRDSIIQLLDAVDRYIPNPVQDVDKPFLQSIDGVYTMQGRGTVVTGRLERGIIKKGLECDIIGFDKELKATIAATEMFHKPLDEARPGDRVDTFVRGIKREDVRRGMVLSKPGSFKTHDHIEARVYFLSPDEGGRPQPVTSGFKPVVFSKTWDSSSYITIPDKDEAKPGEEVRLILSFLKPIPMEVGQRFVLHDGTQTMGVGVTTKCLPNLTDSEKDLMTKAKKPKK